MIDMTIDPPPLPTLTREQAVSVDALRIDIEHGLQEKGIPRHMWDPLMQYVMCGRVLPQFLDSVLSNDLMQAVTRADDLNRDRLRDYATFMFNHLPIHCYGSSAAVRMWMAKGGLFGEFVLHTAPRAPSVG